MWFVARRFRLLVLINNDKLGSFIIGGNFKTCHNDKINISSAIFFRRFATTKETYYDVLGVKRNATASEIKSAYYELSKKYHPDTQANEADAKISLKKFHHVGTAYETLSNKEKRLIYDRYLRGESVESAAGSSGENVDDELYQDLKRYEEIRRTYRYRGKPDFRSSADFDAYFRRVQKQYEEMLRRQTGEKIKRNVEEADPFNFREYGRPTRDNMTPFQREMLRREQQELEQSLNKITRILFVFVFVFVLIAVMF